MMGHKICLYGEIWLIIPKLSLLSLLIWRTGQCIILHGYLLCFWPGKRSNSQQWNNSKACHCESRSHSVVGLFNPIALRTAKTLQSFGLSECNRVKLRLNS